MADMTKINTILNEKKNFENSDRILILQAWTPNRGEFLSNGSII